MSLIKRFLFSLGGLALLASPFVVRAAVDAVSTGLAAAGQTAGLGSICDGDASQCVAQFVGGFLNILLSLLGIVLLVYLLYAGFLWMTAGGDTKQVQTAKDTIRNLVIGAILLVASFAVSNFVLRSLGSVATGSSVAGPSGGSGSGSSGGDGAVNRPTAPTYSDDQAIASTNSLCPAVANPQRSSCIYAVRTCITRSSQPTFAQAVTACIAENHAGNATDCVQCGAGDLVVAPGTPTGYAAEDAMQATASMCLGLLTSSITQHGTCIDALQNCIVNSTQPTLSQAITTCVTANHASNDTDCQQCGLANADPRCNERNYILSGTGDAPIACAQCRQYAQDHLQALATRLSSYRCATVNGDMLFWCGDNSSGAYHPDWAGNQGKICAYVSR